MFSGSRFPCCAGASAKTDRHETPKPPTRELTGLVQALDVGLKKG